MRVTLVLAITVATTVAHAHVGPSKDDNNRYLKLTPQRDRVRLAYTIFFGDVPGGHLRTAIDSDGDGEISEAEAQAFGDKVGGQVRAAIDVDVDKNQRSLGWEQIVVGMGSPRTRAGAFSVDLVANLCLGPGTNHTLILRDRFTLTNPGETEVKLEDTHGIAIHPSTRLGGSSDRDVKFAGPGGPLADDGLQVTFDVTDQAAPATGACDSPEAQGEPRRLPAALVIGVGAGIAFLIALVITLIRRHR